MKRTRAKPDVVATDHPRSMQKNEVVIGRAAKLRAAKLRAAKPLIGRHRSVKLVAMAIANIQSVKSVVMETVSIQSVKSVVMETVSIQSMRCTAILDSTIFAPLRKIWSALDCMKRLAITMSMQSVCRLK
jgi:hypothetical protein